MAQGARRVLNADVAVSVTGLAGPDGDDFGNPVGTVFIGYADERQIISREYHFSGSREDVRNAATQAALKLILHFSA
jgi:PncC family amidohydrolase